MKCPHKNQMIDSTSTNLDYQTYLSYFRYVFLHIPTISDSQPTLCDSSSKSISALFSSKLTGSKETCGTPGGSWRHKGHKVLGILLLFRGWITENYGKTMGKHMETYYAKTCLYYIQPMNSRVWCLAVLPLIIVVVHLPGLWDEQLLYKPTSVNEQLANT